MIFYYLREERSKKISHPPFSLLSRFLHQPRLAQAEARSQEFGSGIPTTYCSLTIVALVPAPIYFFHYYLFEKQRQRRIAHLLIYYPAIARLWL